MTLEGRVREWIAADPDPETRAELGALLDSGATEELASRFSGLLTFGTAGLRGALGGGPNRMNLAVVRRASAGVAAWLNAGGDGRRGVVVGHDHRHRSADFARETAGVLAAAGIPVRLATRAWPTPVTAHAVRHLDAAAAVMVTASHNPAPDNGYKVYDGTGSQIIPPTDREIAAAIEASGPARGIPCEPGHPRVVPLGEEAIAAYLDDAVAVVQPGPRDLRVVYTPVHGVGLDVFEALWRRAGFPAPIVVAEQARPDPDFPTAAFPNPEEPGVLDLALALAEREQADVVIANDPDADRLAVAIRAGGSLRVLAGDELGWVLATHALATTAGDDRVVARSIVSSTLLDEIAADAGVPCRVTLTGFKWISRAGDTDGRRLVFGYEEALGYAVSPRVRDKDGLTAALMFADLAAREPIAGVLARIASRHGAHATTQWSRRVPDAAAFTAAIRAHPPAALAAVRVRRVVDHAPATDLLEIELGNEGRVLVRPSGTEPKVKCYFEAVAAEPETARAQVVALRTAFEEYVGSIGS